MEKVKSDYLFYDITEPYKRKTEGFGTQFDTCVVEHFNRKYTDWSVQVKAIKMSNLQCVRIRLYPEMYERANDNDDPFDFDFNSPNVDFNSAEMQNLYKLLDVFEEQNVKVDLSWYGCRTDFVSEDGLVKGSWLGGTNKALGGDKSGWVEKPSLTDNPNEEFAESVAACIKYLVIDKGYTCIYEYSMFPEPDDILGADDMCLLERIHQMVEVNLKKYGLSGKVKFSGPADYGSSPIAGKTPKDFEDRFLKNVKFDRATSSVYRFHGDMAKDLTVYDGWYDENHWFPRYRIVYCDERYPASSNEEIYNFAKEYSALCDKYGISWNVAESGTFNQKGVISNFDTDLYDRALFMPKFLCNLVNGGCASIKYYVFSDCIYDSAMNELGLFKFKRSAYIDKGYIDIAPEKDWQAKPVWYTWSLMMRYTDFGSEVYPLSTDFTTQDKDLAITAFKLPNGSWTYVVVNSSTEDKKVAISNTKQGAPKNMDVYNVNESIIKSYNGELKTVDKASTITVENGVAYVVVPAKGVSLLTNKQM